MKKISIMFLFLLFFVFCFTAFTYATEIDLPEYPVPTAEYYEFYVYKSSGNYFITNIYSNFPLNNLRVYKDTYGVLISNNATAYKQTYTLMDNAWVIVGGASQIYADTPLSVGGGHDFIESSINIYQSSTGSEIFFPQTPQAIAILAPIVEGTETSKTLAEVLGILPKILVVVVSFLGLRKALKMLSALLHRS